MQHWMAGCYMCYRDRFDMGAVIQLHRNCDDTWHRNTVEVAELQTLIILLDRQTVYAPEKRKPRAWLISVNRESFRVLEAYLDQDVDMYAFHVFVLGERAWPVGAPYPRKDIYGDDPAWKWPLSWVMPQPLN
ncbi:hypothetical protein PG994_004914 [Apiospora phragmitis]|uniref:Uncharacterized protein n=1 Tax=Apiospora phragmitis TaxID=2905665 RepID=A0ABR1VUZ0_9PEZI